MTISMKKKLVTMALSGTMLASGLVSASGLEIDPKVYMGAEVSANRYTGTKKLDIGNNRSITNTGNKSLFGNNGAGVSGFIGTRLNECFGLEAGYTLMSKPKLKLNNLVNLQDGTNVKSKMSNGYIDAMGFIPVTDQIEAIGSLGIGFLSTSISGNVKGKVGTTLAAVDQAFSQRSTKAGVRVGAGLAYKFDECLGARFMLRYQQGNKHIKSLGSAGLGLFYQF